MNILKATALSLTALAAVGLYSAPAMSATYATDAFFSITTLGAPGGITEPDRLNPTRALGDNLNDFRSLGVGGYAALTFGSLFSGQVTIWEFTNKPLTSYPEGANVWVAGESWNGDFNNKAGWISLGSILNENAQQPSGKGFTTDSNAYKFLIIQDDAGRTYSGSDGFDLAAARVNTVPIPAAAWLFGSALLGLAGVARRRKSAQV